MWPKNAAKPYMPHISLIYKKLPESARQAIIQSLSLKESFIFDTLALVCPQKPGDWTAVETWQMLGHWRLDDPATFDVDT